MENELPHITITKHTPLKTVMQLGKECAKCGHCCRMDSGIVLEEETTRIADQLKMQKEEFIKKYLDEHEKFNTKCYKVKQIKKSGKPYGQCVFYAENKGCTIHDIKPMHCKVCSAKSEHGQELSIWFALNFLVNPADPESIRQWSQYLKTHPTIPGGELNELVKDHLQLKKILNYEKLK